MEQGAHACLAGNPTPLAQAKCEVVLPPVAARAGANDDRAALYNTQNARIAACILGYNITISASAASEALQANA